MLDKADLRLYEEVARMPPFQRKTLVLIGTEGIGRRTLKTKLLNLDPDRFGATIPRKKFNENSFLNIAFYFAIFLCILKCRYIKSNKRK